MLITAFIVLRTYFYFSPKGGNYQNKIPNLIIDMLSLKGKGKCLDIGAGSGALIIEFAKKYSFPTCIGLDYWGKNWEYSKQICEENARIERVNERVTFLQWTPLKFPFEDEYFDVVISCLTFHEVEDRKDKVVLLKEALRVLKKGGKFSFLDMFMDKKYYDNIYHLRKYLDGLDLNDYSITSVNEIINLPPLLKSGRALGKAGITTGTKRKLLSM